jgi:hypothetical protein
MKGQRREDGLFYLGTDGIEWTDEKTFRKVANEKYRASSNCSYEWRAALTYEQRQAKKRAKHARLEKKLGMTVEEHRRQKRLALCKRYYHSMTPEERHNRALASKAQSEARRKAFEADVAAWKASKATAASPTA